MMSKMTPSFKPPVRNHQYSPNLCFLVQIISDLNQTSRIDPLATTNLIYDVKDFLVQIISDLDQTSRIDPLATPNLTYDVKDDPILQVLSQEPSTSSKPPTYAFSVKSCLILIKPSGRPPDSSHGHCSQPPMVTAAGPPLRAKFHRY